MKIVQVSHVYLPHIGGLEFYINRLSSSLKEKNYDVDILTTDMNTSKGDRITDVKYFKTNLSFMRNPFSISLAYHLFKNKYDVIHLHNIWFITSLFGAFFNKKAKIITTVHGVYPDKTTFIIRALLLIYKPFALYIIKKSDSIIVLSESEKNKLNKIFKINSKKIKVIPNGIFIDNYNKIKKQNIILFTGRIIKEKNPEVLIKACSLIKDNIKDYKIIFAGPIEKNYKNNLIKLSKDLDIYEKIEFNGPFNQNEKKILDELYKKSSIFISLGEWEGLPTRLLEAMQYENSCIVYSKNNFSELIKDDINGKIIIKLDEKLLSQKILSLMNDQKLRKKLARNARKSVLDEYNWNIIVKKIIEIYEN